MLDSDESTGVRLYLRAKLEALRHFVDEKRVRWALDLDLTWWLGFLLFSIVLAIGRYCIHR